MSRVPPALLYLTIYNPTLQLEAPDPDNEDAEEQAHILFYTAREHAVSRDRILRQVGLAKALINFSEVFDAAAPCESVHSLGKRMIMFSPEPNFWMHACYEVARTPRPSPPAGKGKDASKVAPKGKQSARTTPQYDYHDGSVHDNALRTHFQRGYEQFKLIHGSFSVILSTLGQAALELQLERFFTVWAWKWDVDDENFGTYLGVPLHPSHARLTPLLDKFASHLPEELITFALIPPYHIPPSVPHYSTSLVHFLLARLPPPPPPLVRSGSSTGDTSSTITIKPGDQPPSRAVEKAITSGKVAVESGGSVSMTNFLAMPQLNVDVRNMKWNWPGYLTFNKPAPLAKPTSSAAVSLPTTPSANPLTPPLYADGTSLLATPLEGALDLEKSPRKKDLLDVDTDSLREAISSEHLLASRPISPSPSTLSRSSRAEDGGGEVADSIPSTTLGVPTLAIPASHSAPSVLTVPSPPIPSFTSTAVHMDINGNEDKTEKKRLLYLTINGWTIAVLVDWEYDVNLLPLAEQAVSVIHSFEQAILSEDNKGAVDSILPSATKILQPKDRYVMSTNDYTILSPGGFPSRSEHLFNAHRVLQTSPDVTEVFSRGQNPQHWHVAKRGLGADANGVAREGEAFLEVARKEASLTDVDNALVSIIRRFTGST